MGEKRLKSNRHGRLAKDVRFDRGEGVMVLHTTQLIGRALEMMAAASDTSGVAKPHCMSGAGLFYPSNSVDTQYMLFLSIGGVVSSSRKESNSAIWKYKLLCVCAHSHGEESHIAFLTINRHLHGPCLSTVNSLLEKRVTGIKVPSADGAKGWPLSLDVRHCGTQMPCY
jgi:hypothetical protein